MTEQISLQKDDTQAALEAIDSIECLKGTSDYNHETFGSFIWPHKDTIRAALTAQLTKTDDNVSCPRVANAGDINVELLNALKKCKYVLENQLVGDDGATMQEAIEAHDSAEQAIARAEQKGQENE